MPYVPRRLERLFYLNWLARETVRRYFFTRRLQRLLLYVPSPRTLLMYYMTENFLRKPWTIIALYHRHRIAAFILDAFYEMMRRVRRHPLGSRLLTRGLWTLLKRFIKRKYGYEVWINFYRDVYGVFVMIDLWLWRTFLREIRAEIIPIAYVRYEPKSITPVIISTMVSEARELDVQYQVRFARALMELARGKITFEEALGRYPEFADFINALRTNFVQGATSRKVIHIVPVLQEVSKGAINVFFYTVVADAASRLSDPYLAVSILHDIHIATWRWKFRDEFITEIGLPSTDPDAVPFLLDDLGEPMFTLSIDDVLASPTMAKSIVATGWGKPEEWYRISWLDVVGTWVPKIIESRWLRRRITHELIRPLVYYLGLRW